MTEPSRTICRAEVSQEEISALVVAAQRGDSEAFAEVFEVLLKQLHKRALFLTGHPEQAEDLLQDTMLETWKHLKRFDGRARFFTWLCSIMTHRHYDWLRRWRMKTFTDWLGGDDESRIHTEGMVG